MSSDSQPPDVPQRPSRGGPDPPVNQTSGDTGDGDDPGNDNEGCGCTVNAVAGLAWWYPQTLYDTIVKFGTVTAGDDGEQSYYVSKYYPLSLDISSYIQSLGTTYILTSTWDPTQNSTVEGFLASAVPNPPAAVTVIETVSEVKTNLPTGTFGGDVYNSLFVQAATPTYTAPGVGGTLSAYVQNWIFFLSIILKHFRTPYMPLLYVEEIEVITYDDSPKQYGPGNDSCVPVQTQTQSLNQPQAIQFPSSLTDQLTTWATPSGTLDAGLVGGISGFPSTCVYGSWVAPRPTMIVIVDLTLSRGILMLVHKENTETGSLDGPEPTGGSGTSDGSGSGGGTGGGDLEPPTTATGNGNGNGNGNNQGMANANSVTAIMEPTPQSPIISLFSQTFAAGNGNPGFIVSGTTLAAGSAITIDGSTVISLPIGASPTEVYINNTPEPLAQITQPPTFSVAGSAATQIAGGGFVVAGTTLNPGQVITVAGTTISLGANPTVVVVNGATSTLSSNVQSYFTLGGTAFQAVTVPAGGYVIGGQVLTPGGVVTVSGTTISLGGPEASDIVINGQTQYLPGYAPLTIGSVTLTGHAGTYIAGSITVAPGGTAVVAGTTFTVLPDGTEVVVNGHTSLIGTPASNLVLPTTSSGKLSISTPVSGMSVTLSSPKATTTSKKGSATKSTASALALTAGILLSLVLLF